MTPCGPAAAVVVLAGLLAGCAGGREPVAAAAGTAGPAPAAGAPGQEAASAPAADPARVPDHPALLAPLRPDSVFPRFTAVELAAAGYPDHLHAQYWPGWRPPVDDAGQPYGPQSLVRGAQVLERPGLDVQPGAIRYRGVHLVHAPRFAAPVLLPFVELADWARREVPPLLGHDRPDTLRLRSPADLDEYEALTGHEYWVLYAWRDGVAVIEPAQTLAARTLDGHAAFALVTEWLLDDAGAFPAWFRSGLGAYLAEYGVHLVNYVAEFRAQGEPAVLGWAATDSVLASGPGAGDEAERRLYRTASHAAFLMVWELVEHRGGLAALQRLVRASAGGAEPDAACRAAYGASWRELAAELDATRRPEPLGDAVQPRSPQRRPAGR